MISPAHLSEYIRSEIDAARDPKSVADLIAGPHMMALEKAWSAEAKFLRDRAAKRIGALMQRPVRRTRNA